MLLTRISQVFLDKIHGNLRKGKFLLEFKSKSLKRRLCENKSEEFIEKRHFKEVCEISDKYKRDPILEGDNTKKKLGKIQKKSEISPEYEKYKEKLMFLPSERTNFKGFSQENKPKDSLNLKTEQILDEKPINHIKTDKKNMGNECKNLLSYEYALPYRNEAYTQNITKFSMAERSFVYKDVNESDFRKKAMVHKYKD